MSIFTKVKSFFYFLVSLIFYFCSHPLLANPDWSQEASLDGKDRANIYTLPQDTLNSTVDRGRVHVLKYPVKITGLVIPDKPVQRLIDGENVGFLDQFYTSLARRALGYDSFSEFYDWLGLVNYPSNNQENLFPLKSPYSDSNIRVGETRMERFGVDGVTYSCGACHAGQLFGEVVLGLSNRFPNANRAFSKVKRAFKKVPMSIFSKVVHANDGEKKLLDQTEEVLESVGSMDPSGPGLDTSLAQVDLSLARRSEDVFASKNPHFENNPRPSFFDHGVSDSKPSVWWNLKYKTRWLSDGSVISGNPIYTNFLWNEIGRGADLKKLSQWLKDNDSTVKELTAFTFATQAPRWTDFFHTSSIDLDKAKAGEILFNQTCSRCHGQYQKKWSEDNSVSLSLIEQLETTKVSYHNRTPVIDVGTDPNRYLGMHELSKSLNNLKISRLNNIRVEPQQGYVPPPLVGIWSRWPYMHNNSIPSLCALLTRSEDRPTTYYAGPAIDKDLDYDKDCVGYPENVRLSWRKPPNLFDSTKLGLANNGHDEGIFLQDGVEIFSQIEKHQIIEFLKTL